MTDLHSRTARKFQKSTPHTSFNPQSPFNLSNQTHSPNQSSNKRKTPSKRYIPLNQTQINKTIDFSEFKTHHRTLSVGKQSQFHPLPEIQIAKNKRGAKKGSFLEIWLNEALDEGQGNQNNQTNMTSINDQTLGSLKKYGIDKKLLKSKNISEETIDKIYKKLYVYSKGLGMTFQQIGKLATLKSPYQEDSMGQGDAIIEIFWKAFSKIMENETPYESAFQIVEKNYLKTIEQMRDKMRRVSEEYDSLLKDHKQETKKLQRELQTWMSKFKQLQNEYNVTISTLDLTDKTLNDEVELRLKFEEKINSVYTSYNQIKTKYSDLVDELNFKKKFSSDQLETSNHLKQDLETQIIKCREMEHMLALEKGKVEDLKSQLFIKKEQNMEIEKQILQTQQNFQKQSDQIAQQMQKNKLLYSLLNEAKIQEQRLKQLYDEEKQINKKFQQRIQDLSSLNNKLFQEKYQIHNEGQMHKDKNIFLTKQNTLKSSQLQKLSDKLRMLGQENKSLQEDLSNNKNTIQDLSYQLQNKIMLLNKENENIQKLKQIKDRHQRLQTLAEHERKQAIDQKIYVMSKLQQQELQIQNLKNEISQKQQQTDIKVSKVNKEKQVLNRKISELQQQLDKKDKTLLKNLNTVQQQRIETLKKQRQIDELKKAIQTKQHFIYKLQSQNVLLETNHPLIEDLLKKKQVELKTQTQKQVQNVLNENTMQNKIHEIQSLLLTKNNEVHIQIQAYKKLSQFYKQLHQQRKQFIHPMIYEDLQSNFLRLNEEVKSLKKQIQNINQVNQQFNNQFEKMQNECTALKQGAANLSAQNKQMVHSIKSLEDQNDKHLANLKEQVNKSMQMTENEKKLKLEIQSLKRQGQQNLKCVAICKQEQKQSIAKIQKQVKSFKQLQTEKDQLNLNCENLQKQLQKSKDKISEILQKEINQLQREKLQKSVQTDVELPKRSRQIIKGRSSPNNEINSEQRASKLNKIKNLQSKQITKQLLEHSQSSEQQHQLEIEQEEPQKLMSLTQKQKQKINVTEKKKVEKSEFKRALKLTFMRR